jgi:hypothetical protein
MAYQGITARIPVGMQGFSGSKNPSEMQPGHLQVVEGVMLEGGVIRKLGGAQKLNAATLGSAILAGTTWNISELPYDIVFLNSGSVMRGSGGAFPTTLVAGLTADTLPPPVFVVGGGETVGQLAKLFIFSKSNQVKVLNSAGTAFASITTPPADWAAAKFPTFGAAHVGRLWGGGNTSDPHRIYYSTASDHQNFTGADSGSLAVYPGEGDKLVAGVSYREKLILFKYPRGIYIVDTADPLPANWRVAKISNAVGTLSQNTVVIMENDLAYLDHVGSIHMISATNTIGDVNTSNLSHVADIDVFVRERANLASLAKACGIWYSARRELWFFIPRVGDDSDTLLIIVNFNSPQVGPRFLLSTRDVAKSMWLRQDATKIERPMIGDDVGFVWQLDHPTFNKDGVAYPFRLETADTDLGYIDPRIATRNKNVEFLELTSEPSGSWSMKVEVWMDDALTATVNFGMGVDTSTIGAFALGTNRLSTKSIRSQRMKVGGSGRRIRLVATNDGLNEDISLAEFFIGFSAGDERTRER